MSVKVKTRKAVRGRFKITGSGRVMHAQPGRRHILTKKSSKRKRHLKKMLGVVRAYAKLYARIGWTK